MFLRLLAPTFGLAALLLASAAFAAPARVAILPIIVHATDDHEYLRSGMSDMLTSRMGRIEGLVAIRVDDPEAATSDAAAAQEHGRAVGADFVLFGSFTRFGEGASLDVHCVPTNGDATTARRVFVQSGTLGEIIPQLDELAQRVGRYVASGGEDAPAPIVAAPEPEALPAVSAPAGGAGPAQNGSAPLTALEKRIQALERVVFPGHLGAPEPDPAASEEIRGDGGFDADSNGGRLR